jgi:hypothetical protein
MAMTDKEVIILQKLVVILGKKAEVIEKMPLVDIMDELIKKLESPTK